jgi:hypothetical protein
MGLTLRLGRQKKNTLIDLISGEWLRKTNKNKGCLYGMPGRPFLGTWHLNKSFFFLFFFSFFFFLLKDERK